MAATNHFLSIPYNEVVGGELNRAGFNASTGETTANAGDRIELRMMRYTTGTTETGLTRKNVLVALEAFARIVAEHGIDHAGGDMTLP